MKNNSIVSTAKIIKKYGLLAKKSFGQNFLISSELLEKIVNSCDYVNNENILEIGTGPIGLTTAILNKKPKKLVSVDLDKRCIEIAKNELLPYFSNLILLNQDALKINESKIFSNEKFSIISNLPYNIGTVLLIKWLKNLKYVDIQQMILLLQKEVVERLVAKSGTKQYGRLSILAQYCCNVKKMFDIKPTAFVPQPKVISSVVKLQVKNNIDFSIFAKIEKLSRIAFSKKRKTLFNNLSHLKDFENVLGEINVDKNLRAENLSVDKFVELAKNIDFSI